MLFPSFMAERTCVQLTTEDGSRSTEEEERQKNEGRKEERKESEFMIVAGCSVSMS